eukprot:XP_001704346.1 Hypothetical protein GL50803_25590 [Giardia lamblia ATCC 50803]
MKAVSLRSLLNDAEGSDAEQKLRVFINSFHIPHPLYKEPCTP